MGIGLSPSLSFDNDGYAVRHNDFCRPNIRQCMSLSLYLLDVIVISGILPGFVTHAAAGVAPLHRLDCST
jgi:hypothetical protein